MTISNAINNIQFTSVNIVTFTSNGTYTPPSNLLWCQVECVGGGGGSCGLPATGSGQYAAQGSGGAGSYLRKVYARSALVPSVTVTVGAAGAAGAAGFNTGGTGGSTTFLTLTAGGGGGSTSSGPGSFTFSNGGVGGTATNGDLNVSGTMGDPASRSSSNLNAPNTTPGPFGGSSTASVAATGFIGGGGGGGYNNTSEPAKVGYAGGDGIVIITEYLAS